jgi:arrestin-related trafficking adapter 4/5/7
MPIDESGNLVDQTPNENLSLDIGAQPPPTYRDHIFDQLYANIDNSGFRTPAPQSGMSTPFYNQSRSGSAENVSPSMDRIAGTDIRPDVLSNRLQNLSRNNSLRRRNNGSISGGNTPPQHGHGSSTSLQNSFPRSLDHRQNSQPTSAPLSRRASEESDAAADNSALPSGRQSPEHIDYSEMDLSRVPSYMTAVRAPARVMSTTDLQSLPNYEEAISAPPSPQRGLSTLAVTPPAPSPETNLNSGTQLPNPAAGRGLISRPTSQYGTINSDESRRFHLLQTRGRAY